MNTPEQKALNDTLAEIEKIEKNSKALNRPESRTQYA